MQAYQAAKRDLTKWLSFINLWSILVHRICLMWISDWLYIGAPCQEKVRVKKCKCPKKRETRTRPIEALLFTRLETQTIPDLLGESCGNHLVSHMEPPFSTGCTQALTGAMAVPTTATANGATGTMSSKSALVGTRGTHV